MTKSNFPVNAPSANPVFYRTYSRRKGDQKEHWGDVVARCVDGLNQVGRLSTDESVSYTHLTLPTIRMV